MFARSTRQSSKVLRRLRVLNMRKQAKRKALVLAFRFFFVREIPYGMLLQVGDKAYVRQKPAPPDLVYKRVVQ